MIHGAIGEFTKTFAESAARRSARGAADARREAFRAAARISPRRARSGGRASCASRAGSPLGRRSGAPALAALDAEIGGELEIPFGERSLQADARAPTASSACADGRYAILDYKTGAPPTEKQVRTGLSPQLTLEGAILRQGGFKDIPPGGSVAELVYVRLRGGAVAGEEKPIKFKDGTPDEHADHALSKLTELLATFADPATSLVSFDSAKIGVIVGRAVLESSPAAIRPPRRRRAAGHRRVRPPSRPAGIP